MAKERSAGDLDNNEICCYGFLDHAGKYTPFIMLGIDDNSNFDFSSVKSYHASADLYYYEENEKNEFLEGTYACFANGYAILSCFTNYNSNDTNTSPSATTAAGSFGLRTNTPNSMATAVRAARISTDFLFLRLY